MYMYNLHVLGVGNSTTPPRLFFLSNYNLGVERDFLPTQQNDLKGE